MSNTFQVKKLLMEENKKDILINVKVDNQDAINATEQLKAKYKQLTDQAVAFDSIDYDNASIGELRDHLGQANNVLKELKKSGLATEQQLSDMSKTVGKLKDNIAGIKIGNVFKGAEASIMGVVGSAQLLQGAMGSLGIESEAVEESIAKMMALMSLKDGVESLGKYADGMKGLMGATAGASSATNILRIGFASLGIGLLISAVVYLTNNWDSLSKTVKEFLPEIDGVTKYFKNIQPIMEGVGKAVIGFVIRPIQGVIKAIKLLKDGEFKQAGLELIDALNPIKRLKNVVEDFKSGYAQGIVNANKKKNEEVKKDNKKANNEALAEAKRLAEEQKKLIDEVFNYIVQANKLIEDSNKSARQRELDDLDAFYQSQIEKAEQLGVDTAQLLEARRIKQAEINKKYDDEEIKNAKDAKEKALQAGVTTAQTQGQTDVLNTETANDGNTVAGAEAIANAKLEALKMQYEAEQELYADNKEKLALIDAQYNNSVKGIETDLTNFKKDKKKEELDNEELANELKLSSASSLADALGSLASEHTVFAKGMAVTSAIINTYQGATKALATGGFAGIAMGVAVVASGLASVKKILSTKIDGAKGGKADTITAPTINTTQLQPRSTQDVRVVADTNQQKTFNVNANITNRQLKENQDNEDFYNKASTI